MESPLVLPDHRHLCPRALGFVEKHFTNHDKLRSASFLESELKKELADSNANLNHLRKNLVKLVVSWISRSITFRNAICNLNFKLHSPSSFTSQFTDNMMEKILSEFSQFVKEVCRVETLRNYAVTTLQLEALVGDLEDAVLCIMIRRTRSILATNFQISLESQARQERLFQAVKTMNDIEEALINVMKTQPQWCHLMNSVDTRVDAVLAVLRPQVFADHRALLASLGWPPNLFSLKVESGQITELPNPLVVMPQSIREIYSRSFLALCALQHLQSRRKNRQLNLLEEEHNAGLWAVDELVSSIASQTEYHFSKWAIDQPEFIFTLVSKITRDFVVGVDDVLQPLIDRARLVSCSAKEAWVTAMVQMLAGIFEKKVFSSFAERYKEKHLKSELTSSWFHLIDLIVAFDIKMQSLLNADAGSFDAFSRGVSVLSGLCDRPEWLKIWAKMEFRDAWKKLKAELNDENAWSVTGFHVERERDQHLLPAIEDHKAPLIAQSAIKIAWELIERCRTLPAILARSQFIRSTAERLLWSFCNVMLLQCKRPEFSSGHLDDDALMRMSGSINAARYIKYKLQEWSDDISFMDMRIAESDLSIHRVDNSNDNDTCFFSEVINSLAEIETDWLMQLITHLIHQFEILSWDYFHSKESAAVQEVGTITVSAGSNLAVSFSIVDALEFLRSQLQVIQTFLNPIDFMDLWRSVADGLDRFIFCSILEREIRFSDETVNQFGIDVQALLLVFRSFCMRPEAFFPCLGDSIKLLRLDKDEVNHLLVDLSNDNRMKDLSPCKVSHLFSHQIGRILRMRKFGI